MGETSLYKLSVPMARTGQREEIDPRGNKERGALGVVKGGGHWGPFGRCVQNGF